MSALLGNCAATDQMCVYVRLFHQIASNDQVAGRTSNPVSPGLSAGLGLVSMATASVCESM